MIIGRARFSASRHFSQFLSQCLQLAFKLASEHFDIESSTIPYAYSEHKDEENAAASSTVVKAKHGGNFGQYRIGKLSNDINVLAMLRWNGR